MTAGRCMDQTVLGRYAPFPCSYAVTPVPVSINPLFPSLLPPHKTQKDSISKSVIFSTTTKIVNCGVFANKSIALTSPICFDIWKVYFHRPQTNNKSAIPRDWIAAPPWKPRQPSILCQFPVHNIILQLNIIPFSGNLFFHNPFWQSPGSGLLHHHESLANLQSCVNS